MFDYDTVLQLRFFHPILDCVQQGRIVRDCTTPKMASSVLKVSASYKFTLIVAISISEKTSSMIDHFYVVVRNKLWNLIEPIVNGRELPGPRQCGNLDILTIFFSFVQIIGGLCLVMTVCPTRGFLESLVKLNGNGVYVLIIVSALLVVTGIVGWIG